MGFGFFSLLFEEVVERPGGARVSPVDQGAQLVHPAGALSSSMSR